MTNNEKNIIRLLIDIIRDNISKDQRKNYSMIQRSLNILTPLELSKEELAQADEMFRNKLLLNIWYKKMESKTFKDPYSDLNRFEEEIDRRKKEQEKKRDRINNFVESYLKEKFKYMR